MLSLLCGQCAFALYDQQDWRCIVARDAFGIVPAFVCKARGPDEQLRIWAASAFAGLPDGSIAASEVPPGCALVVEFPVDDGPFTFERFDSSLQSKSKLETIAPTEADLRDVLQALVSARLMTEDDVEVGVLLLVGSRGRALASPRPTRDDPLLPSLLGGR